ncbi:hypothetical protein GCK72_023596 [Caenorhabditis remanei]|uniref:Uncharacterized protein n=1 Tax=Caenorhabditis remanei TaxID=31234 RepID=A0A6A5FX09_CAERE|nr:hypothetical protein GCK72_023596 [Caenorhabditis remanei]KAF1747136.1 hypothetical protein GCK72_023596 [Caenorhabditis remanei]
MAKGKDNQGKRNQEKNEMMMWTGTGIKENDRYRKDLTIGNSELPPTDVVAGLIDCWKPCPLVCIRAY